MLFPLKNESGSILVNWIGYGIAETISRKLQELEGFQVWDPVFLFHVDSSGYDMHTDSTLSLHRSRWRWDVALGGGYTVFGDTLRAHFELIWATGREEPLAVTIEHAGAVQGFFSYTSEVLWKAFQVIQYQCSARDSTLIRRRLSCAMEAYQTYAAGYGYEMAGDNDAALTAYLRAGEIDPKWGLPYMRQGILYRNGNDFEQARKAGERAQSAEPENPRIAAVFADFLVNCATPSEAIKYINAKKALLGKTADGMKAMGTMHIAAGEYQRAIALLTKAVAFGPSDLDVEFALGSAYSIAGDFTRAADIFNHLIQYRPYHVRFYASLGGAYRKAGRLMESTIVLESAEEIEPDNTMILVDLAHTYIRLGWYEKAGQLLQRARELAPSLTDISTNLGVVLWYQGKKDEAMACFEQASRMATTRQAALNNIGNTLFMGGSVKKAIKAYKKANMAGRRNETVLYNLATAYLTKKNRKKAARYFDEMLSLNPERLDVLVKQASIAVSLKRYGAAEEYYRRVIELVPDHEVALRGLITILFTQKRYKESVQPLEDFLAHQPLSRECLLLLASAYEKMEWYEVALMKYQTAVKEYAEDPQGNIGVGICMYMLIKEKGLQNYDAAILALKKASDYAMDDPRPDLLIGILYADYKGYRELAVDHWKKALSRAKNKRERKTIERKLAGKG
ncbi:MAG: tetratricopeptide repeat protein [Chitinispirillaceae bacterium]|nr:tetratricopeptide repeat protein [Chitinispirillaceae bacterium]